MAQAWELHDGSAQVGPLPEDQILTMIATGMRDSVLMRAAGTEEWKSLRTHAPFAIALERRQAPQGQAPPPVYAQPATMQATTAEGVAASGVRILGGVVFVLGLVGTVPGCVLGGPGGFLAAFVLMVVGFILTRVSAR